MERNCMQLYCALSIYPTQNRNCLKLFQKDFLSFIKSTIEENQAARKQPPMNFGISACRKALKIHKILSIIL
jgi:hypothetical protein